MNVGFGEKQVTATKSRIIELTQIELLGGIKGFVNLYKGSVTHLVGKLQKFSIGFTVFVILL